MADPAFPGGSGSMATVPRVELRPGYSISRVITGGWQLSAGHREMEIDRPSTLDRLERMADAGLTTFDGADIYGGVEALYGELLRRRRRARGGVSALGIQVHTKLVPDRSALDGLRRSYIEGIIDRSLRRLGVEALDLVQFHWWDWQIPGWLDALGWLDELVAAGKVRHLGVTNFDVEHLRRVLDAGIDIAAHQIQYSVLDRRAENGMVGLCTDHDVHLLCYGTLAGGFLTNAWYGRSDPGLGGGNRSLTKYRLIIDEGVAGGELPEPAPESWERFQVLLGVLARSADHHGVSIANIASRWVLDRERVAATIIGARSDSHLADNLAVFAFELADELRAELEVVLADWPGPRGPIYGLERVPGGRHAVIMKTDLNRSG